MAVFLRHGVFKLGKLVSPKHVLLNTYATKAEKKKGIDRKVGPKIEYTAKSLAAKGFLRPQKDYTPPDDVEIQLEAIFKSVLGTTSRETKVTDLDEKFKLFKMCSDKIGHTIPNSLLHSITTLEQVVQFYKTPIDVRTPLDKMKTMELPENLHVEYNYNRFHPDTDTKFKGISAFPQTSTIVTGLKYKKKYPGFTYEEQ